MRAAIAFTSSGMVLAGCMFDVSDGAGEADVQIRDGACDNTAPESIPGREIAFDYSGRRARLSFCTQSGELAFRWTDSDTGEPIDVDALAREDARAFKQEHHALDPLLVARLTELADEDPMVEVDVWYALAEDDLPAKEEQVASVLVATEAQWEHEQRVFDGALRMQVDAEKMMGADAQMLSDMDAETMRAPFVRMRVRASQLEALGDLPYVSRILLVVEPPPDQGISDYYYIENEDDLDDAGADASSRTVAMVERTYPDVWARLPGAANGIANHGCVDNQGTSRSCHCPGGLPGGHSRGTIGIVRTISSQLSYEGFADQARTLAANVTGWDFTTGRCAQNQKSYGQTALASAVNWSLQNGASVLNFSWGGSGQTGEQDAFGYYLDYVAAHYPWPLIAAAADNSGPTFIPTHRYRNGLIVGGSDDNDGTTRSGVVMWSGSHAKNTAAGWELPHLVAEARNPKTAIGANDPASGTSFAAPQVAGMAASLQEWNTNLISWPEPMMVGLLVGCDENVDEASGGVWPLNLNDAVDDRDGAGLINGRTTKLVLASNAKQNGGNFATFNGHDYGTISPATAPNGFYTEVYNAMIDPGQTLVAASILMSASNCTSGSDEFTCTANPYPTHAIAIFESPQAWVTGFNAAQNYAIASVKNNTGFPKFYQIKILVTGWSGVPSTSFGIAWAAHGAP